MSADDLRSLFAGLEGARIPGGCEVCDAYQTFDTVAPGIHALTVHHDDWCPVLARRGRRRR